MQDIILSGDGSENFVIDKTGLLLLNRDAKIDYETRDTYNLAVTVTDIRGNSKATVVTIEVVDIPEDLAQLDNLITKVNENSKVDTLVGTVSIISQGDSDITSMKLIGENSEAFTIDEKGEIKVAQTKVSDDNLLEKFIGIEVLFVGDDSDEVMVA